MNYNNMKKNIAIAFVAGILLTIFSYHAYTVYQLRAIAIQSVQDHQLLTQVVQFINSNTKQTPAK